MVSTTPTVGAAAGARGAGAGRMPGAGIGAAGAAAGFWAAGACGAGMAMVAAVAAVGAAAAGAAALMAEGAGILMVGEAVGFGGKLMRTVCFFASEGLGGTAAAGGGVPAGGGLGGVGAFSDIFVLKQWNESPPLSKGKTNGDKEKGGFLEETRP